MKFCKNCGSPVSRGVIYCPVCNCKVDEKIDKAPKVVSSQNNIPWYDVSVGRRAKVSPNSSNEKKSISKIYIFIIIFLLLILFLILILL